MRARFIGRSDGLRSHKRLLVLLRSMLPGIRVLFQIRKRNPNALISYLTPHRLSCPLFCGCGSLIRPRTDCIINLCHESFAIMHARSAQHNPHTCHTCINLCNHPRFLIRRPTHHEHNNILRLFLRMTHPLQERILQFLQSTFDQ